MKKEKFKLNDYVYYFSPRDSENYTYIQIIEGKITDVSNENIWVDGFHWVSENDIMSHNKDIVKSIIIKEIKNKIKILQNNLNEMTNINTKN